MSIHALTSAEISLPTRPDAARVRDRIAALASHVDLVGLTDNHAGQPRMSPLAAVALAREQGVATVVHVSCRDRNRLALRSQVVGAAALGCDGVLCLYGDSVPGVPRVRDYTTTRLLAEARAWVEPYDLSLGCVVAAGADFAQTQMVFDPAHLAGFLRRAVDGGKLGDCRVYASVPVIRTRRLADILDQALPFALPEPAYRQIAAGGGVDMAIEAAVALAELSQ